MNLDDLRSFVVLAEMEHATAAAAALHTPQPTLSRVIARLEAELGVPLFDRPGRRLRLNGYGRVLRDHARQALAVLDTGARRIASLQDPDHGSVRLGFLGSLGSWLVPRLLTHYRQQITGTALTLTAGPTDGLLELLRDDRLDLVLLEPTPPTLLPGSTELAWQPLHEDHLCLAVPADHPLATRSSVRLTDASQETFLTYQPDTGLRRMSDRLCQAAGIDPRVSLESSDVSTVDALVAAGMGVALRPSGAGAVQIPGVVHIPLDEPEARRVIGIAWVQDRTYSAAVTRFRNLALEAFKDPT